MSKKFQCVSDFRGYTTKPDKTNIGPGYLVAGSQNVFTNDGERVAIRKGYTLDGVENNQLYPITSSFEWKTRRGLDIPLRKWSIELDFRYNGVWYDLFNGLNDGIVNFCTFYDDVNIQDSLLFVNGTSQIYQWYGGITTFASATAGTITKQGLTTWKEEGFTNTGIKSININGTIYTYSGGEGTTTITGVTPNPLLQGITVGQVIFSTVDAVTGLNTPAATFTNDIIANFRDQIYVGSLTRREIFISKFGSFTDYTFTSPVRKYGEGDLILVDDTPTGFIVQEDTMYVSGSRDKWYQLNFTVSADNADELLQWRPLKTSPLQSAISQSSMDSIKNDVGLITFEPSFDTLGRIQNIAATPQAVPLSDPIKPDFDSMDVSEAHVKFYKNNIYIAFPHESRLYVYNVVKQYWEAPWILPIQRLAIIDGDLFFHSNATPTTYKLFDGYNDNGNAIDAQAYFSYMNFGVRTWQKNLDEWYTEGYIEPNTDINLRLLYDYTGSSSIQDYTIEGDDDTIIFNNTADGSLGKNSLGKANLGGAGPTETDILPPKFRHIQGAARIDFYEVQPIYSSNGIDQRWELLAFGPDAQESTAGNSFLVH